MKITKKLREEAALACQLAASNNWHYDPDLSDEENFVGQFLWSADAYRLANAAYLRAERAYPCFFGEYVWAEAESLLRTGWMP